MTTPADSSPVPAAPLEVRAPRPGSEFYVNYLPMPSGLRAFLRWTVPVALSALALVAAGVALRMRHPGDGAWPEEEVALEGIVHAAPWPVLRIREPDGSSRTILLAEYGKLGADRAVARADVDGHRARIRGTVIQRDGRRILELAARPDAIEDLGAGAADPGWVAAIGAQAAELLTIEGEIVDPKCYLGAMRPGQGEVHRSCARVCIAGGIPAGLITPGASVANGTAGGDRFYLLLDQAGVPLGDRALAWVGRPVCLTGTLESWDDLSALRVTPEGIRPIDERPSAGVRPP